MAERRDRHLFLQWRNGVTGTFSFSRHLFVLRRAGKGAQPDGDEATDKGEQEEGSSGPARG